MGFSILTCSYGLRFIVFLEWTFAIASGQIALPLISDFSLPSLYYVLPCALEPRVSDIRVVAEPLKMGSLKCRVSDLVGVECSLRL